MKSKLNSRKVLKILLLVCLYLSLPLFLLFSNPQNLPLPLVITPVALLFLIVYVSVYLIFSRKFNKSKRISKTRLFIMSAIVAIIPVLLIVLASIQQFTLRDIILSAVIVIFVSWYLLKVDFLKT
jgi:hypothetical protein